LTKLFTVFVFLIEAGDANSNEPITKYVPELLEASEALNATENPIDYVAWEDITIGVLASQLADIGRDYSGFGELDSILNAGFDPTTAGLPTLNATETPVCEGGAFCNRQQFFQGFTERHPVYAPGTAPIYSNAAYMILSYALENITGIDFPTSVQNSVFSPLNLSNGTSWFQPSFNDTAIIPDNSAWSIPLGDETA
jgi:CubicO group peptidase (beta-lactamase class C family)